MQHDPVELRGEECAVPVNRVVLGADVLERPRDVRGEDHVDDVLAVGIALGGDRLDDCDRPLERDLGTFWEEACLLPELSPERPYEALTALDPTSGKQPHLVWAFLVPDEENASAPAQDRRDTNPGFHDQCADDPKPRPPRSVDASSATSTSRTVAMVAMTS